MSIKPGAAPLVILEQIIEDQVTGLTLQFSQTPSGETRLYLFGDLPLGNREFHFDNTGALAGTGTCLCQCRKPTWIKEV